MKVNPHSMIANAFPLLTILFFRQASSQTFLRSASSSSIESGSDDINAPCSEHASYEGKWKLMHAYDNDNEVSLPSGDDIMFDFLKKDSPLEYDLSIDAANVFGTSISIIKTTGQTDKCSEKIDVGLVRSTKMLPPQEFQDIENFLSVHLENMKEMKIAEEKGSIILVMSGDDAIIVLESTLPFPIYQGKWKVTGARELDIAVTLPDDDDIIIQLDKNEGNPSRYNWYAKATNIFSTNVDIVGTEDGFDLIQVGNVASTMMIPMEKHEDIERFFGTALEGMYKMSIVDTGEGGETLVMRSDTAVMKCERFVQPRVDNGKWEIAKASDDSRKATFPDDTAVMINLGTTPEVSA